METVCHKQLRFESLFSKEVIADLEGGWITSDAGFAVPALYRYLERQEVRYVIGFITK